MSLKIFVIDNEECVQTVFRYILEDKDCVVTCADSFNDAIGKFSDDCNIAFVDIFLGDGQGDELVEILAKKSPDTIFYLMTGHPDKFDEIGEQYRAQGINLKIMLKPIWQEQINKIMQELATKGLNARGGNIAKK